jgi:hypothetical protein
MANIDPSAEGFQALSKLQEAIASTATKHREALDAVAELKALPTWKQIAQYFQTSDKVDMVQRALEAVDACVASSQEAVSINILRPYLASTYVCTPDVYEAVLTQQAEDHRKRVLTRRAVAADKAAHDEKVKVLETDMEKEYERDEIKLSYSTVQATRQASLNALQNELEAEYNPSLDQTSSGVSGVMKMFRELEALAGNNQEQYEQRLMRKFLTSDKEQKERMLNAMRVRPVQKR